MSIKDTNPNRRADQTRKAILRAAIREFSTHGLAGARTDAIAESAKVNKALLYYYFKSKQRPVRRRHRRGLEGRRGARTRCTGP